MCAVQERREQWNQFSLKPAPPKLPLQEYIDKYQETGDELYLAWFLHWYEPTINQKIEWAVSTYAMADHFDGLKGAYLLGLTLALKNYDKARGASFLLYKDFYTNAAIHDYIRTMRTAIRFKAGMRTPCSVRQW